jgi:peptidoglycan hydrolase-like protein with peptidoglycan-binding domain
MACRRCTFIWLLIGAFATALLVASFERAQAGSRGNAGAAAAGLALGLIIGGMANQNQGNASEKTVRNCSSIFGPGAVNSSSNPARCVCRTGYGWTNEGGSRRCVARGIDTAPGVTRSVNSAGGVYSRAELERIQESLNLLGYDAGSVDGAMGQKTQQAILKFQGDKQLPQTGHLSAAEQQILLKDVAAKRGGDPGRQALPAAPSLDQGTKADPRMELAYWETVRNSKVPAEIEDYIAKYPTGEFTSLARIRLDQIKAQLAKEEDERKPIKIEAASKDVPPGAAQLPPLDEGVYPRARQRRVDAVAVIIGNTSYRNGVPSVEYGARDAEAMRIMAEKTLGIDRNNILFIKDATRGAMNEVFGGDKDIKGSKLWRLIDPDGRSDVYVFYSGHGVPGINDAGGANFLLPVDGDPNHANLNGYPLKQLYDNLAELRTKSVTVFLDACFSGQASDANGTPLIKQASPVFITKPTPRDTTKVNVFAAAGERQLSSWDSEAGHGIFTRYVLAGLAGEADDDKNKEVTAKELRDYVSRQVRRAARRMHGREQEPWFEGDANFVLSSF